MDGLYEIVPSCVAVEIDGLEWLISPLRLADYAELEQYLLHDRRPPLEAAIEAISGQSVQRRKHLLGLAFDEARCADRATHEELDAWLRTDEGILHEFWLRLRPTQPGMSFANVEALFGDRVSEVASKMASAAQTTGEHALGNSLSRGGKSTHPSAAARFRGEVFSAA